MKNPVFVLVHGAWSVPWCWRDLLTEFERDQVRATCVSLASSRDGADPAIALEDDVNELVLAIHDLDDVVLVGHSYGGSVVTEASPRVKGLRRIIYIAALVPLLGESSTDVARLVRVRTRLDDAIEVEGGHLRLDPHLAGPALYGECSATDRQWAVGKLTSQTVASFRSPRTADSSAAPTLYIKCRNDRAVDPGLQNVLAARCDEHLELESDHSPFLSHPQELAHALLD